MKKLAILCALAAPPLQSAHAFGLGDIVHIGLQVGGELVSAAGSAAVDAITESMRDPEAEARKKAEEEQKLAMQMQEQINEIESRPDLRPIDRERLIMNLRNAYRASKEMESFIAKTEAQQKAERDKIFTVEGIAGAVGKAALSSPSMAMLQADMMMKDPLWNLEREMKTQAVLAQADAQVAMGIPQAKAQLAMAQADALFNSGMIQADVGQVVENAEAMKKVQDAAKVYSDSAALRAEKEAGATSVPTGVGSQDGGGSIQKANKADAFSPDIGKRIWIEFEDAPTETAMLRKLLRERGHTVVESREEADVAYLIQGEFTIPETKMHDGLVKSVGNLLEIPEQSIEAPAGKTMGMVGAGISSFLLAASGANVPSNQAKGYRQDVLIVVARQPKDGKETRASVVQRAQGETIEAVKLAKAAKEDLYRMLGV